jgi:hypothetical protein
MAKGDIETYQAGGLWHNHMEGRSQVLSSHATKVEAESAGRQYAIDLGVQHIIRSLTGQIYQQNAYTL